MKMMNMLLLLSILLVSAAVAQEADTQVDVAVEEMEEAAVMHTSLGAQVRLLQLEKEVLKRSLYGEQVLEFINNNSINVSLEGMARLEAIVSEMGGIKDSIIAELDKPANETTVQVFVQLKDRAINLTQEFRTIIRDELTVEQRQELMASLSTRDFPEVDELEGQIRERAKEFNSERVAEMFRNMGIGDDGLVARIQSGDITVKELRDIVKARFKELNTERKESFLTNVRRERAKVQLMKHIAFAKKLDLSDNDVARIKVIVNDETLTSQEIRAKLNVFAKEKISERKERVVQIRETIKVINDDRKESMEQLRERMEKISDERQEILDDAKDRLMNATNVTVDARIKARLTGEVQ